MIVVSCSCGAKYKVGEDKLGKWAVCKACGGRLRLAADGGEPPIELAPPTGLAEEAAAAATRSIEAARGLKDSAEAKFQSRPEDFGYAPGSQAAPPRPPGHARRYFRDVLWSFLLFTNPHNLAIVAGVWIVMVLMQFSAIGCFYASIGMLLIHGWYAAFRLNIIGAAANGEEDLPNLGETFEDPWEGLILPLLKFLVTWLMSRLPLILYAIYLLKQMASSSGNFSAMDLFLGAARYGDYSALSNNLSGDMVIGLAASLLGLFMWPMFLLVAALGGISALVRIDLMVRTIVMTFPAYICTVLLICAAYGLEMAAASLIGAKVTSLSNMIIAGIGMTAVSIYIEIIAMRVIGLYYHHFKGRFAWSWG